MNKRLLSLLMLTGAMVIFGTVGLFRRLIPLASAPIALLRGAVGLTILLLLMLLSRKKISFPAIRKNLLWLILSGACLGINWILLFEAYNYTSVAVATVCYYTAPVLVMLVSPLLLKERITLRRGICIFVALIGTVFVSGILKPAGTEGDLRGVLFGLGAAAFYGAVMILNQKIRDISAYDKTITQLAASTVVLLPYVLFTGWGATGPVTPTAIVMLLILGVVHTGIAYALFFGSMTHLPAQTVALFSYADPAVAILVSAFVLTEPIGVWEILGIIFVLGATIVSEFPERKPEKHA